MYISKIRQKLESMKQRFSVFEAKYLFQYSVLILYSGQYSGLITAYSEKKNHPTQ